MQPVSPAQLAIAAQIRTAHQVSQRFSQTSAKYTGKTNESLADKFQIYRTVARDYQLTSTQKVALVHNLFDEEALRYYNAHVRDQSTTLEQVYEGMYAEFNSVTRQDRCKNQLRALRLHTIVETKNMMPTEALDYIRDQITLMITQCPKPFASEAFKTELLRDSVIGNRWATVPISKSRSNNYNFQQLFQDLHSSLHQHEEELMARRTFSRMSADPRYHPYRLPTRAPAVKKINYTGQGRYGNPRTPGSRSSIPRLTNPSITVGKNGLTARGEPKLCFSCGSPDHVLPCPKNTDLQSAAIQKLRDNPLDKQKIFKEFMVQMEDVMAAEEDTPEEPIDEEVDDYIDNSKDDDIDQGEEVTAYYTNFEQDSNNLRDSAVLSDGDF
jgi:hypothetical protein